MSNKTHAKVTKHPEPPQSLEGLYGFAARGNEALVGLNPWSTDTDRERIAAEQEWVRQHDRARIGSAIADAMITLPAGGLASLPARAIGTGLLQSLTTPGDTQERAVNAAYGALGAGLGEGAAGGIGRAIHPFRNAHTPAQAQIRNKALEADIPLNAAQHTGSKTLGYLDSLLDWLPSSRKAQKAAKTAQAQRFNQAGIAPGLLENEAVSALKGRINAGYNNLAQQEGLIGQILSKPVVRENLGYSASLLDPTLGAYSFIAPKIAQSMLWRKNGYLSNGLLNMEEDYLPGLLKSKLLSESGRIAGSAMSREVKK